MNQNPGLPNIRAVGFDAPFEWLSGGVRDYIRAPFLMSVYGLGVGLLCLAVFGFVFMTHGAFWALVLLLGLIFLAPMLAMGVYETGRLLELNERPTAGKIFFLRHALKVDVAYLGLALVFICFFWFEIAHVTYALNTFRLHKSFEELAQFAFTTPAGHTMLTVGSIIGGAIAFFVYSLVVITAPMLLHRNANVFVAVLVSLIAVGRNLPVMALWAVMIALLALLSAATAFVAFTVVFPVLGLASWRAYRALVDHEAPLRAAGFAR